MSTLDFLSTNLQIGDPAPYKPAKFGEVVQSALYSFGQRTGFEITPVLETAQDYSDRDNTLKQRFTSEELTSFTGTDDELKKEVINLDAQKGIPFAPNYTPEINNIKNQKLDQAIIKGRDQDPIRWQGIKTTAELQEEKRNRARSAKESYEEIASRASPTAAFIGSLIGGLGAAFTDPINIATLPFGATSSMGILKAVKTEALLNAAVEAAEVPLVASWQKELGYKYGIGDAAMDITTAGIAGGALAGIIKGARPVIEALGRGFDASGKYIGSKSQPILQKIGDSEKLPSSVRDAAKYMSRVAHIDENNPMGHVVDEGIETKTQAQNAALNRQILQDTQDAFRNYEQPIYDEKIQKQFKDINSNQSLENFIKSQGSPVYHGSLYAKDIKKFDINYPDKTKSATDREGGIFFSNKAEYANQFTNRVGQIEKTGREGVIEAFVDRSNFLKISPDVEVTKDYIAFAKEAGWDGIEWNRGSGVKINGKLQPLKKGEIPEIETIVFNPDKIKTREQLIKNWNQLRKTEDLTHLEKEIASNTADLTVEKDLLFRPNDALTSIQKDIEVIESLNTGDTFKADFERLLKDNPDLEIETEAGRLTLREIKDQITEDETILSAIKTCAIGKK